MSTEQRNPISLPAGSDLSASLFCGVTVTTAGLVALPAANASIIGVLYTAGTGGQFACGIETVGRGKLKLKYGGTVAVMDPLKVTSAGKFITASAADVASGFQVATALKAGALNDIGEGVLTGAAGNAVAGAGFDTIVLGTTAPSNLTAVTFVSTTGTVTGVLANGVSTGQTKRIVQNVAASSPVGTITGTFKTLAGAAATTLALGTAVGTIVDLIWDGAAWRATSALGGTGSSLS
jgi:hypothetical protein